MIYNSGEELGYVSSSPDLVQTDTPKPIDEAELSTIEQLFDIIQKQKAMYNSVTALDLSEELFTVKEQLSLNAESLRRVTELETLLRATINKVREKMNGNNY